MSRLSSTAHRALLAFQSRSFVTRTLLLGLATMVVSGIANALAQPAGDEPEATAELVDSIVAGRADPSMVPRDFHHTMGYEPEPGNGVLRHPNGDCSTPVALGPDEFETACQVHDLGYDVLRYSEREGHTLRADARLALDWRLYEDLLRTCETATCSATATVYYTAVTANSVRQGYKVPHAEPAVPWVAVAVAVVGLGTIGGSRSPRVETRPPHRRQIRSAHLTKVDASDLP